MRMPPELADLPFFAALTPDQLRIIAQGMGRVTLEPYAFEAEDSHLIGKTISESKFFQKTGATIIGIRRDKELILTPGPQLQFHKNDKLLLVGSSEIIEIAKKYLKNEI